MKKSKVLISIIIAGVIMLQSIFSHAQSLSPIKTVSNEVIRPFKIHIAKAELTELNKRILETRWPDRETVMDQSQGIKLEKLKGLVEYWGSGYDWRKIEKKLNSFPQFITTIDGIDIHFIHVRSKERNALPLIISHGWPGSIIELLKIIDPLTNPVAYGGKAEDAFDVVIPSLPGYGFSGKPEGIGWGPDHIGEVWAQLMKRLGYNRYVAQGGDWGAAIVEAMGRQAPEGLAGIHINNLAAVLPAEVGKSLNDLAPAPKGLSEKETVGYNLILAGRKSGSSAYNVMMTAKPQTVGYGITDSPAGLAAWLLGHPGFMNWSYGSDPNKFPTKDDVLDDISLYWLTNSAVSASRIYWENAGRNILIAAAQKTNEIRLPVAITVFGEDGYLPSEAWARNAFPNLSYFHEVEKGGHFAAWEQPQLFAEELRSAFMELR